MPKSLCLRSTQFAPTASSSNFLYTTSTLCSVVQLVLVRVSRLLHSLTNTSRTKTGPSQVLLSQLRLLLNRLRTLLMEAWIGVVKVFGALSSAKMQSFSSMTSICRRRRSMVHSLRSNFYASGWTTPAGMSLLATKNSESSLVSLSVRPCSHLEVKRLLQTGIFVTIMLFTSNRTVIALCRQSSRL